MLFRSIMYDVLVLSFALIQLDLLILIHHTLYIIHSFIVTRLRLHGLKSENNLNFTQTQKKTKNAFEFDSVVSSQADSSQCAVTFLLFS